MKKSVTRTYCDACHAEMGETSSLNFSGVPVYYKGLKGSIDLCDKCVSQAVMSYWESEIYDHVLTQTRETNSATSAVTSTGEETTKPTTPDPTVHRFVAIMRDHF